MPQTISWNPDFEPYVGLKFQDKAELQRAIKLYSIKRHQKYETVESKKDI